MYKWPGPDESVGVLSVLGAVRKTMPRNRTNSQQALKIPRCKAERAEVNSRARRQEIAVVICFMSARKFNTNGTSSTECRGVKTLAVVVTKRKINGCDTPSNLLKREPELHLLAVQHNSVAGPMQATFKTQVPGAESHVTLFLLTVFTEGGCRG